MFQKKAYTFSVFALENEDGHVYFLYSCKPVRLLVLVLSVSKSITLSVFLVGITHRPDYFP